MNIFWGCVVDIKMKVLDDEKLRLIGFVFKLINSLNYNLINFSYILV